MRFIPTSVARISPSSFSSRNPSLLSAGARRLVSKGGKLMEPRKSSVTPHLVVRGAKAAIDFYVKAFGAVEHFRMPAEDGERLLHSQIGIGDGAIFLCDEFPEYGGQGSPEAVGGSPVTIHLIVKNADETFANALAAGATEAMPLADMFWGDRYGKLVDPFGHHWSISHPIKEMTPEEMMAASKAAMCPS
jgi:uncharacterized glyoxalase superfamily protein PhnB